MGDIKNEIDMNPILIIFASLTITSILNIVNTSQKYGTDLFKGTNASSTINRKDPSYNIHLKEIDSL